MQDFKKLDLKALVVEDNRNFQKILRSILVTLGIREIAEVESAPKGIKFCEENDYDVAFVDFHLPKYNGVAFARRLRSLSKSNNRSIPLFLLTADTRMVVIRSAIDAGFEAVLSKPISPMIIQQRLQSVLSKPFKYIDVPTYFGPCRRRIKDKSYRGPERRVDLQENNEVFDLDDLVYN